MIKKIFGLLGSEAEKWLVNIESQINSLKNENAEIGKNCKRTLILIDDLDKRLQNCEKDMSARKELEEVRAENKRLNDTVNRLAVQLDESKAMINRLQGDGQNLKSKLEKLEKEHEEALSRKDEEKSAAADEASRMARKEVGGMFETYGELYRRFMKSEWAADDTAMKSFYCEDYVTFFALCSNEKVVEQFYDELSLVIGQADREYVEMADRLLDFCVRAGSRAYMAEYSRQEVQEGSEFDYDQYRICGSIDGERVSRVVLRGITKDGRTLLGSYVERGI